MNITSINSSSIHPFIGRPSAPRESRAADLAERLERQRTERHSLDADQLAAFRSYAADATADIEALISLDPERGDEQAAIGSEQIAPPRPGIKSAIDEAKEQAAKARADAVRAVETLLQNFEYLDRIGGGRKGRTDNLISVADLRTALQRQDTPKELRAAIEYVLNRPSLLEKLDIANKTVDVNPDGKFGRKDFEGYLADNKVEEKAPGKQPNPLLPPSYPDKRLTKESQTATAAQPEASSETPGPEVQAAIAKAKSLVGKDEDKDTQEIQDVTGIDPSQQPWCAAFAMNILEEAGVLDLEGLDNRNYCPSVVKWAKDKGIWGEAGSYQPKPGDAIVYDFEGDGKPDHMGIVENVTEDALTVIEGNAGTGVVKRKDNLSPTYKGIMGFIIGGKK
jgi:hypothetical protein